MMRTPLLCWTRTTTPRWAPTPLVRCACALTLAAAAAQHYAYDDVSDVIQYAVRGELDVLGAPHVPNAYPVFKQCDSQWGSDVMVRPCRARRAPRAAALLTAPRARRAAMHR